MAHYRVCIPYGSTDDTRHDFTHSGGLPSSRCNICGATLDGFNWGVQNEKVGRMSLESLESALTWVHARKNEKLKARWTPVLEAAIAMRKPLPGSVGMIHNTTVNPDANMWPARMTASQVAEATRSPMKPSDMYRNKSGDGFLFERDRGLLLNGSDYAQLEERTLAQMEEHAKQIFGNVGPNMSSLFRIFAKSTSEQIKKIEEVARSAFPDGEMRFKMGGYDMQALVTDVRVEHSSRDSVRVHVDGIVPALVDNVRVRSEQAMREYREHEREFSKITIPLHVQPANRTCKACKQTFETNIVRALGDLAAGQNLTQLWCAPCEDKRKALEAGAGIAVVHRYVTTPGRIYEPITCDTGADWDD